MQRSSDVKLCYSVIAIMGLLLFVLQSLPADAQTPTPEQVEAFRNLPPDQQRAILEAMGQSGSTTGAPSTTGTPATPTTGAETDCSRRCASAARRKRANERRMNCG